MRSISFTLFTFFAISITAQNVGIGTLTPSNKLDVNGDATIRGGTMHIWPDDPASQEGAQINLSKHGSASNGPLGTWGIDVYQNDFRILNNDILSPAAEFVRIKESGNVGIGTVNPVAKLEVNGDIALNEPFKLKIRNASDGDNYLRYEATLDGVKLNGWDAVFLTTGDPSNPTAGQDLVVRNGRVGINTTTPSTGLLHVNGFYNDNFGSNFVFYANNGSPNFGGACCAGVIDISIFATNRIVAAEFDAFSDARAKRIIGLTNNEKDLQTLKGIEITNYRMKDAMKDTKVHKKVIAQQVEKVYPLAVSKTTDVIPDIYEMAEADKGLIRIKNSLKKGDKVKLVCENKEILAEVTDASTSWIVVDNDYCGKVFVYGKQVDDFRTVDYTALSMLNMSATQQLSKLVEQLQKENVLLRQNLNTSVLQQQQMRVQIEEIKAQLPESSKKTVFNK